MKVFILNLFWSVVTSFGALWIGTRGFFGSYTGILSGKSSDLLSSSYCFIYIVLTFRFGVLGALAGSFVLGASCFLVDGSYGNFADLLRFRCIFSCFSIENSSRSYFGKLFLSLFCCPWVDCWIAFGCSIFDSCRTDELRNDSSKATDYKSSRSCFCWATSGLYWLTSSFDLMVINEISSKSGPFSINESFILGKSHTFIFDTSSFRLGSYNDLIGIYLTIWAILAPFFSSLINLLTFLRLFNLLWWLPSFFSGVPNVSAVLLGGTWTVVFDFDKAGAVVLFGCDEVTGWLTFAGFTTGSAFFGTEGFFTGIGGVTFDFYGLARAVGCDYDYASGGQVALVVLIVDRLDFIRSGVSLVGYFTL